MKSVVGPTEIVPVLRLKLVDPPGKKVRSFPFRFKTVPAINIIPPLAAFPINKSEEPPDVESKIVFAVVAVILNHLTVFPAPVIV
jgi:hypothetical protein